MKPIRVLLLTSGLTVEGPMGGVARHAYELCKAFDRSIVEPILGGLWHYQTPFDDKWLQTIQNEGIEAFIAADWDENHQYTSAVRAWRTTPGKVTRPVHIIHSHGEFSDLAALLLRYEIGAKALVRTVHNEYEWSKRPIYGKIFPNFLYPLTFERELGVSRQVVANLNKRPIAKLRHRNAIVVHNAINVDRFSEPDKGGTSFRTELQIPPDVPVVGSIGRLTPQKGYDRFIEAAKLVLAVRPNTNFLLVGEGRSEQDLRWQAFESGVDESFIFTGPREDIEAILSAMDVFVSSSLWEGLPTVVLESMASKTPVVATDVSGNSELVIDGETGILVAPGDAEALADGILRMLSDPIAAETMAERAYAFVDKDFRMTSIARQLEDIYQELVTVE